MALVASYKRNKYFFSWLNQISPFFKSEGMMHRKHISHWEISESLWIINRKKTSREKYIFLEFRMILYIAILNYSTLTPSKKDMVWTFVYFLIKIYLA